MGLLTILLADVDSFLRFALLFEGIAVVAVDIEALLLFCCGARFGPCLNCQSLFVSLWSFSVVFWAVFSRRVACLNLRGCEPCVTKSVY